MPTHKERTGKTRFGMLLKKVMTEIPELAGDVMEVFLSPNPLGSVLNTVKEKLAGTATGAIGDHLLKEINDIPEDDLKSFEMSLADIQGARKMYTETGHEQADKIAERIMKVNLPYIIVMASVNVVALLVADTFNLSTAVVLAVGNVIGMVIQSLINERAQVVGFYMGSSIGSKLKDKAKSLFSNK